MRRTRKQSSSKPTSKSYYPAHIPTLSILTLLCLINSLESTMYTQNHTRAILLAEKKTDNEVMSKLKSENLISDRAIKQGKLAQSKKEAEQKKLKEQRERLHEDVEILNTKILADSWTKDVETRKKDDRNLTKRAQAETMQARQESNLVEIDISIAESRIKDLEN